MPRDIDLSIVIVAWNCRDVLDDCLASVFANVGALRAEVIVVDNASSDGSADMVERDHARATLIRNDVNAGFAGANNQGLRVAGGRYVLLLNPDTVVLDGALEKTIAYADAHPTAGVVGCQVMESEAQVQRTCFRFPSVLNTLLWLTGLGGWRPRSRVVGRAAYGPWDRCSEREVDVVSGMFMLVRREALDEVGPMDDAYFVFAEEADWCYRFWQAGWRCVFAPVARILHVDGGSKSTDQASVRMYVQMQKSLLYFHRKNLGLVRWAIAKTLFGTSMIGRSLWWWVWGGVTGSRTARHKAAQSTAAMRFHWTGKEPAW